MTIKDFQHREFRNSLSSFLWNTLNNDEQNDFVKLLILLTIATNSIEDIEEFLNTRLFYPSLVRLVEKLRKKLLSIHYHNKTLYSSENKELRKLSEELLNENLSPEYRLSIAVKKFLELILNEFVHGGYREQILFCENSVEILYKELIQPIIERLHLNQQRNKEEFISSSIFDELRLRLSALSMVSPAGGYVDTLKFLNDYFTVDVGLEFPTSTIYSSEDITGKNREKQLWKRLLTLQFLSGTKKRAKAINGNTTEPIKTVSELIDSTLDFLRKEFSVETEVVINKLDVLLKPKTVLNKLYETCPNTSVLTLFSGNNRENINLDDLFLFVERNNLFETKFFSLSNRDGSRIKISFKGLVEEFLKYLLEESEIRELFPVLIDSEDEDKNTNKVGKKLSSSKVLERFYILIERAKRTTNELFSSIEDNKTLGNRNGEEISTTTNSVQDNISTATKDLTYTILVSLFPALVIDFLIRRVLSLSKEEREQKNFDRIFRFETVGIETEIETKTNKKKLRVPTFGKLNMVYLFGEYLTKKVFPALGIHTSHFVVRCNSFFDENNLFELEFVVKSPEVLALRRKIKLGRLNPFSPTTLIDIEVSEVKNVSFISLTSSNNTKSSISIYPTLAEIKVSFPNNSSFFTLRIPFSPESTRSLFHLQQTISILEVLFSVPVLFLSPHT